MWNELLLSSISEYLKSSSSNFQRDSLTFVSIIGYKYLYLSIVGESSSSNVLDYTS